MNAANRSTAFLLYLVFATCLGGCGSKLPIVEGVVTIDGEPLADARIVFEAPDKPMAVATTNQSGEYTAMTGSVRGMAAGSYKVAISAYATRDGGNESPIPILRTLKRYNSATTSGLSAEIKEGRNENVDFPLARD